MTVVETHANLRRTREAAALIRYEPNGSISATNVQDAIEEAASSPPAIVPTAVNFGMSPYTVLATDNFLAVDTSGGAITINLPVATSRAGVPLTIKDVTGNALANNVTINPNGAEKVDTLAPYLIDADFGGARFVPKASGGWTVDA